MLAYSLPVASGDLHTNQNKKMTTRIAQSGPNKGKPTVTKQRFFSMTEETFQSLTNIRETVLTDKISQPLFMAAVADMLAATGGMATFKPLCQQQVSNNSGRTVNRQTHADIEAKVKAQSQLAIDAAQAQAAQAQAELEKMKADFAKLTEKAKKLAAKAKAKA